MIDLHHFEPVVAHPSIGGGVLMPTSVYASDVRGGLLHHRCALLVEQALGDYWQWAADGPCTWVTQTRVVDFQVRLGAPLVIPGPLTLHLWLTCTSETTAAFAFRLISTDHQVEYACGRQIIEATDLQTGATLSIDEDQWDLAEPFLADSDRLASVTA